jgi:sialic acid synthase SpsE
MKDITFESSAIGRFQPCWIIAELSANQDGNPEKAAELIKIAAAAGVNAVKFQTYVVDDFVSDSARITSWGPPHDRRQEPIGDMFARNQLPWECYRGLWDLAHSLGLTAFSSAFDLKSLEFLEGLNTPVHKIASSDVNNEPLLKAIANTGKPVILSSGKSTLGEIDFGVRTLEENGAGPLSLLHCAATYPTKPEDCNLNMLATLQAVYPEFPVGFSDHSEGSLASVVAVTLGAQVIEKHITYNRLAEGPDHWFSLDPEELGEMVTNIRKAEAMRGDARKKVLSSELEGRKYARTSVVANQDIKPGMEISREMLKTCRPGTGLAPDLIDVVVGRQARRVIRRNEVITWDCI